MEQIRPERRVLVFGDDTRAFLTVVRSLGRKGIKVHAVPFDTRAPALKSRYIERVHVIAPYDQSGRWISELKLLLASYHFDLIIPCCDRSIRCLDAHRCDLVGQVLALPSRKVIDVLFDKQETRKCAERLGVPVPSGRLLRDQDTPDKLIAEYGLPMLVKERCSYTLTNLAVRGRAHVVRSEQQLALLLGEIDQVQDHLVETYFSGRGVGVSVLTSDGRITCAFQHARLKEPRDGGGSSLRASRALNTDLLACCEKLAKETALDGVAMFEFRVNEDTGEFVLLEVNARFWGSLPLPVALGVDFPCLLFDQLVERRPSGQIEYEVGVRARNLVANALDVLFRNGNARAGSLGYFLADLVNLFRHPFLVVIRREVSDTFQSDDLRPAFAELLYLLVSLVSGSWRGRTGLFPGAGVSAISAQAAARKP